MDEPPIPLSTDAETAHKIGHKSARSPRLEVITRNDRRRTWTLDQKREIVAESLGPALTTTESRPQACHQQWAALHVAPAVARRTDDDPGARNAWLHARGDDARA